MFRVSKLGRILSFHGQPRHFSRWLSAVFLTLSFSAQGQLPELSNASSTSGLPTSAAFFGGASLDNGQTFVTKVGMSDPVDVLAQINVQPDHIGFVGNYYILIILGEDQFVRSGPDNYVLWDGTVEGLKPALANKVLAAQEALTIVDDLPFGAAGISNMALNIFLAYDTSAAPGELFYSGTPLSFVVGEAASTPASQSLFVESVSPSIIQTKCIVCHVSGGVASTSGLILQQSLQADYQINNYNTLIDYIANSPNGAERLLAKPQGLDSHGGGVQLIAGSNDFELFSAFVASAIADIEAQSGGTIVTVSEIFGDVVPGSSEEILRRAALLLAGRLPTESEIAAVAEGDEAVLRSTLRGLMDSDGFSQFLLESANDRFLTEAFTGSMFQIVNRKYYPNSAKYFQNISLRQRARLIADALAEEPLRLMEYVVTQERPYTEIVTADYTMMNPFSGEIYNSALEFADPDNYDDWKPGQITDYFRCSVCSQINPDIIYDIPTDYPHAGILNSPAFLSRYPSTETNRNRARARWAYYFFLGVDIEAISERTTDQEALQDLNNPTLNNPNCVVCHDIMDPVAGAFQNYSDDGFYRSQPGGNDSLPFSYKRDRDGGYQIGDTWYSDMLMPGFATAIAPDATNSIQWLGQQFTADSRFGVGTVNFWYPAIMGRELYTQPENPEDPDYQSQLAAYSAEQSMVKTIAAAFTSGSAGNGAFNLKDLLIDLILSDQFKAAAVIEQQNAQAVELFDVGAGRLLTPEQLNRKLQTVTGFSWSYGNTSALQEVYGLIYGGIDSIGITERATELTTLMSTVVTAMANEASCSIVNNDFAKPQSQRKLFPLVELSSLPGTADAAIKANLAFLHQQFLGESLSSDSTEITASYELFTAVRNSRLAAGKGSAVSSTSEVCIFENIANPITQDANQTLRSWAAVVNYLMRDYRFIFE